MYEHKFEHSSMLDSMSYNDIAMELTVVFMNGRTYTYEDVPYNTYTDIMNAPSAGAYFNSIKNTLKIKS